MSYVKKPLVEVGNSKTSKNYFKESHTPKNQTWSSDPRSNINNCAPTKKKITSQSPGFSVIKWRRRKTFFLAPTEAGAPEQFKARSGEPPPSSPQSL